MKIRTLACYGFWIVAGFFLARYELHTDDTGIEVFLILLITFILGCWHPRHAWQWALLVGPCAPAADLCESLLGKEQPAVHSPGGLLTITAVVILIGLGGSNGGALLRKALSSSLTPAGQCSGHSNSPRIRSKSGDDEGPQEPADTSLLFGL
jgi:hypothetical protein